MNGFVVPHDPGWSAAFAKEAARIRSAFGTSPIELHHIGSTAIPGILAKPIIDSLGVVHTLADADAKAEALAGLGYEAMGAYGIEGRRYFRRTDASGKRTHHLHVFRAASPHVERHIAFRDYLRAHSHIAAQYSALKAQLTRAETVIAEEYITGKDPFVRAVELDAVAWYRQRLEGDADRPA